MQKISLDEKFSLFHEHWRPKTIAALNGQEVKLVKVKGEFPWHHHEHEDELFLVVLGSFRMDYRDDRGVEKALEVGQGEFVIVPRGVLHRPVAEREVHVVLFEPAGTLNTGNVRGAQTVEKLQRI